MTKILYWSIFGLFLILLIMVWQWPKPGVLLTVCDVGQGDGVVIQQGYSQLLVDAGPPGGFMVVCLGKVMAFWDRQIETITLSHADSDHSGGLAEIFHHYRVKQVIVSEAEREKILPLLPKQTKLVISGQGDNWVFGDVSGRVLWPPKQNSEFGLQPSESDRNAGSLVWRMEYGKDSVWFAGDADEKVESALIAAGLVKPSNYLKVGHHGSKTASSDRFLAILQPHQAWISVGKENRYGHPNREVIERLEKLSVSIWRTDQQHQFDLKLSGE